ncbi:hypothetical protein GCM10028806_35000 [Spirosoma terrae]|uniref:DUF4339 domain-containing protein n=1 Tax=Spirosoma terrae TaxID=1968276 RepID=A0A6L9LL99_9BACT|nr:DUF4339 domain-containing protein [Spirosoma terrae]NDU97549.1 DUF4339 domain-containing protein [Spirosoma terrae]
MKKYYLMKNGGQLGPYAIEEMYAFHLTADTMVWYQELGNWKMVKDAPELRHLLVKPDNSKKYWYLGGLVAFLLLAGAFYAAFKEKEGSEKVAKALASEFSYYAMKTCNSATGSNATFEVKDWECKDKRYTIDVISTWEGTPYGGNNCTHEIRSKLMVNEDGTERDWKIMDINGCMETDASSDYSVRAFLRR